MTGAAPTSGSVVDEFVLTSGSVLVENQAGTYIRFILASILVVLGFATFQHLVILNIPLSQIQPAMLGIPAVVGSFFGFLLAKVRILNVRSQKQLELLKQRDLLLQREITARKFIERSLREQGSQLELANEELKTFSYSVSHDLRSPLRAVSGFSDALSEDYAEQLDDIAKNYLSRIRSGCLRMDDMIDSLLMLSRVSRADVIRESVDLSKIAAEVIEELQVQNPVRDIKVEIEPGLVAKGDSRLLTVVLENLLRNAWKFTVGVDKARISFKRSNSADQPGFCVSDNGAGFDMQQIGNLFVPFSRLHTQEKFSGSGIGLATVQRALLRQGGRIWAEGEVGKGATFCFSI